MLKKRFSLLAAVLLLVMALPLTAAANGAGVIDEPLDFTLDSGDPGYPGPTGEGWAWNGGTKALTLSGINVDVGLKEESFAIKLPDGASVILAAGSVNKISNSDGIGILCCDGSLAISGGGDLSLDTYNHGIRAFRNLTIDMTGNLKIAVSKQMGLRVGNVVNGNRLDGDLSIRNCNSLSIATEDDQAIRADGDVAIGNCSKVSITALDYNGIRNFGDVMINNCGKVKIAGFYNGIRSEGNIAISGCPDGEVSGAYNNEDLEGHGILTPNGGVTISDSALKVYGAKFGIATGPVCYSYGTGGDITINRSYVSASCKETEGFAAAIFAGDDLPPGVSGSKILLNDCVITAPEGGSGRVLDVHFELIGPSTCQSITGLAGITAIDDPDQMARAVTIKPLFALTYKANGGSGSMADPQSPYISGTKVTVLSCTFTAPKNQTFSGWNTKANGSGTAYAPGASFKISGPTTLYAQYKKAFTVTFDAQGGSAVAALTSPANKTIAAPAAPSRKGYTFGGWYKDAACKKAWNFATDRVEKDITLYAKWIPDRELPATAGGSATPAVSVLSLLGGLLLLLVCRRARRYA